MLNRHQRVWWCGFYRTWSTNRWHGEMESDDPECGRISKLLPSDVHDGQRGFDTGQVREVLEAELLGRRFGNGVSSTDIDQTIERLKGC